MNMRTLSSSSREQEFQVPGGWDFLSSMEKRFRERPTLLKPSVSCCIFKAPRSLVQMDAGAYKPQIVSIGPYHHGWEQLSMVEQHKPRFFAALLDRTNDGCVGVNDYFHAVAATEAEIRNCYSEALHFSSSDLLEMMILDACFIVEMFRFFGSVIADDSNESFLTMPWIFPFLQKDLLLIENQIPFFVLQTVFDLSMVNTASEATTPSLSELALSFFNVSAQRPQEQWEFRGISNAKHLLDLFRLSLISHSGLEKPPGVDVDVHYSAVIPSATQLLLSGINCNPRKGSNKNLLDIKFLYGVLKIPPLTLDDFMSSFLLNCVAFEQCCSSCSSLITSYITFMRCLVNKEMDAKLLAENQLLVNYFGSHRDVATFFNDLGKVIAFDIRKSYLAMLFREVNRCYETQFDACLPRIIRYSASSWSTMVAVASFVVSILTFLSAFYTIYAYYSPRK